LNNLLDIEWISRNFLFIAYPFMVTGVLIQRHGLVQKLPGSLVWSLLVVGCALLMLEAANNYTLLKTTRHSFDSLLALGLVCPVLFLAAARSNWRHESRRLSDLSMVIYFVHPLFISLLVDGIGMTNNGFNVTCWTLVLSVLSVPLHDGLKSFLGRTFQPSIAAG
jgi:surface polysaccharide O-acyltransferase-like enzyme